MIDSDELDHAPPWTLARRSLRGDLPLRYKRKLQFEFDRLVDRALLPTGSAGPERGMTILDVGSGRRPCVPIDRRPPGCTYVGLDISADELQTAPPGSYDRFVVG